MSIRTGDIMMDVRGRQFVLVIGDIGCVVVRDNACVAPADAGTGRASATGRALGTGCPVGRSAAGRS